MHRNPVMNDPKDAAEPSAHAATSFEQQIADYRASLQKLEQEMQGEYDKAVMALSGGAFGVSLTFLKDIIGTSRIIDPFFLLTAWIAWGLSVTCVLFSYFTSTVALRAALDQVDDKTLYLEGKLLGKWYNVVTKVLNICGGVLFLIGISSIVLFVSSNIPNHGTKDQPSRTQLHSEH
jgi:uncharacterized membrane protein YqhA